ncbi:PRD domain-containing protein [Arachnia rubra]|uniref:HTH domain-containing protein n=1 Tax=Arachnia rubra TaxID=1547448 RepID=A0ABX7Y810_9ACTN|nr:HTH domain-containing protein [Arachnia rubra]QUC08952.1 HTH domain-containing protein [Arachnia rubra]BCR80397.1 PTS modulated transcriptional regulator MtlR family protein [Arachnia rubra]
MSRAAQILNALESTRATSADEFAALLGVSRRTVAGEVSMLQELLGPVASITLVEGRYRLLVADPPRYRALRSGLASSTSFNDPAARTSFIIARLFHATRPVKTEELAQEMSVGRTTVVADLNRVRKQAGQWELTVEGRPNVGLSLAGPELQQRLLILRHHYATAYGHHHSEQRIERAVAELVAEAGLDPVHIPELTRWAFIATDRTRQSRPLGQLPVRYQGLPGTPAHTLAARLAHLLTDVGTELAGSEITFLALPIAGMRTPSDSELAAVLSGQSEPIEDLVDAVLEAIHDEMQINLSDAPQLSEFTRHLAYMINRMRYRIWVDDSGVASIGEEFPVAHRMAEVAARVIRKKVGLPVDSSELAFLAAYFQVFLEAVDRHPRLPLQIAIVSSAGRVTAELVRLQLTRLLPPATQYRLLPAPAVSQEDLAGFDLVVSTGQDPLPSPVPVLQVGHILDRRALSRELDRLHLHVPGSTGISGGSILAGALDEQHFFALPPGTSYADALDYMTGHLEARGHAEEGFGESIRKREASSTTQLDSWVGFPHATLTTGSSVLLAIGVIPRRPEEDGVRLIVLLGLPRDPRRSENILIPVYDAVLRLGTRRDLLTRISRLTTFEQFYYFLATNPLTES